MKKKNYAYSGCWEQVTDGPAGKKKSRKEACSEDHDRVEGKKVWRHWEEVNRSQRELRYDSTSLISLNCLRCLAKGIHRRGEGRGIRTGLLTYNPEWGLQGLNSLHTNHKIYLCQ